MAVYKVPQDVEADDKLIGPFSFRQFIYLIVVAISIAGMWGLAHLFIALAILPLPVVIFFGILALPLRKDQPMETYLSAVVSFYFLKSRKRMWQPDGIDSFITIIPPKDEDIRRVKDLNEDEATRRLDYLAGLVDSHGWSVRGEGVPAPDTSINSDLYYESQSLPDMMDAGNSESERLTQGLANSAAAMREGAIGTMQVPSPTQVTGESLSDTAMDNPLLDGNPVLDPLAAAEQYQPATPFNPLPAPAPVSAQPSNDSILDRNQLDAIAYANALAEEASDGPRDDVITPMTPIADTSYDQPSVPVATPAPLAMNDDSAELSLSHDDVPPPTLVQPSTPLHPINAQLAMQQTDIPPQTTSTIPTPDATIEPSRGRAEELAGRTDVSVETLQKEARRMEEKDKVLTSHDEVKISLR